MRSQHDGKRGGSFCGQTFAALIDELPDDTGASGINATSQDTPFARLSDKTDRDQLREVMGQRGFRQGKCLLNIAHFAASLAGLHQQVENLQAVRVAQLGQTPRSFNEGKSPIHSAASLQRWSRRSSGWSIAYRARRSLSGRQPEKVELVSA